MPRRLLHFSKVTAGRDPRGGLQIYYGDFYVGKISHSGGVWSARLHDILLGEFDRLEDAMCSVAEWYYGPGSEPSALWLDSLPRG